MGRLYLFMLKDVSCMALLLLCGAVMTALMRRGLHNSFPCVSMKTPFLILSSLLFVWVPGILFCFVSRLCLHTLAEKYCLPAVYPLTISPKVHLLCTFTYVNESSGMMEYISTTPHPNVRSCIAFTYSVLMENHFHIWISLKTNE